jgi:hypothetical protein
MTDIVRHLIDYDGDRQMIEGTGMALNCVLAGKRNCLKDWGQDTPQCNSLEITTNSPGSGDSMFGERGSV